MTVTSTKTYGVTLPSFTDFELVEQALSVFRQDLARRAKLTDTKHESEDDTFLSRYERELSSWYYNLGHRVMRMLADLEKQGSLVVGTNEATVESLKEIGRDLANQTHQEDGPGREIRP